MIALFRRLQRRLRLWLTPTMRLSLSYVLILLVLSIIFSVVLYHFAVGQLVHGLGRQYDAYHFPPNVADPSTAPHPFDPSHIPSSLQSVIDEGRRNLILSLVYFNIAILLAGSWLSYWLARRTVRPIEAALEAQSRFTADASHELRTPLAVMRTEIEIARADPKLSLKEANALLDSNLEETIKLHALAEGLLRLARSENERLALAPVKLESVVSDALQRVKTRAAKAEITLVNDAGADEAIADRQSLIELITILLDNAIKYSSAGSGVTISTSQSGHHVSISVADQGRGIDPEALPHIFERFYRADSSRTSLDVDGHGLGLSIADQIATLNRASIRVQSKPDAGSIFTVSLQRAH